MILFVLGLIIFFGAHLFTALARPARGALIAQLGPGPYKGLYALVSLVGFALIIIGWPNADATVLYAAPAGLRNLTYILVLLGFILLAAAYLPAGQIAARAKHPMLAAVKLWAFGHLLVNGDVRSVLLFGSFLAYAVVDRILLKRRDALVRAPLHVATPVMNDMIAVIVGAGAAGVVALYLHRYIAGVALF